MIAIVSLLLVVAFSLLVTRVATVALMATGLPQEVAKFQARTALTGVGYTTRESETIVSHPVRRRVVLTLMLVGNAGFVTIIASMILSFANSGGADEVLGRLALLVGGLVLIILVARSRAFERRLTRLIARGLNRFTDLDLRDYVYLMQLTADYAITELQVEPGDWLADKSLIDLELPAEGVIVLGIQRADGSFVGAPRGETVVHAYDNLILYGRTGVLSELDERPDTAAGDRAHEEAIAEHQEMWDEDPSAEEAEGGNEDP